MADGPVLLTELGAEHYNNQDEQRASHLRMSAGSSEEVDSDEHDDDDDVLLTPKKTVTSVVYENDIYNEKKYETDLEGMKLPVWKTLWLCYQAFVLS